MYPVMLDVRDRPCLVVGGGGVALRKVQGLLEEGARVTVVAPVVSPPLAALAADDRIILEQRRYRVEDVTGRALVLAATDDPEVNRRVGRDAAAAGVWANLADDPGGSTFHVSARVRRGPLQLAIGSAGQAPFVVRRLRQVLERRLGPEWGEWLDAAQRFRADVQALGLPRPEREQRYDRFFAATVDAERLTARVPGSGEQAAWLAPPAGVPRPEPSAVSAGREPRRTDGWVALVGAGPGAPGLMTVRGRQRLLAADAVVFDRLAAAALPPTLAAEVELHPVGKTAGNHPVPQPEITALLVRLAREGKRVVRLKGGDPYVFGRGGEEAEVLAAEGIRFEVVPGVTSGVAALAWAGIPVTHRREAVRVTLLTAHEAIKSDGRQVRWDLLAQDRHATIVGYMGVTALPAVVHELLSWGMPPETPAAMVSQGSTAAQRRVVATVAELPAAVVAAGLEPPALFVIGPTVRHAARLDWFGQRPLAGERLVTTLASPALAAALEDAGADVVAVPSPVGPAARVVLGAQPLTGCVVASPAEVDLLDDERDGAGWSDATVGYCIGAATSARAAERGWRPVAELEEAEDAMSVVAGIVAHRRDR